MPTTSFSIGDAATLNTDIRSIDVSGSNAAINTGYTITLTGNINLVTAGTITDLLAVNLPSGSSLTIEGNNFALDGGNATRGLFVYAGAVAVDNLTIQNAKAVGGAGASGGGGGAGLGGGLFVASGGSVRLNAVNFIGDAATGGAGSSGSNGGGGGLGGAGGAGQDSNIQPMPGGGGGIGRLAAGATYSSHSTAGYPGIVAGASGGNSGGGGGSTIPPGINRFGGSGGFGGGGHAGGRVGGNSTRGGSGGFGGGAGSGSSPFSHGRSPVLPGFGGGGRSGGGGLGAGGDIFIQQGGSLTIEGGNLFRGAVTGGAGPTASNGGRAYGSGIFIQGDQTVSFANDPGQVTTVSDVIADMTGSHDATSQTGSGSIDATGSGKLVLSAANTFTGGTAILGNGTLELTQATAAGSGAISFAAGIPATLQIDGTVMPANTISGFAGGDTIDLHNINFVGGGSATLSGNKLQVVEGGTTVTLQLGLAQNSPTTFSVRSDGLGGTNVAPNELVLSGSYTSTIVLSNPTTQNPALFTATGRVEAASGDGVLGSAGFPWTLTNLGTVVTTAASGDGVDFQSGGVVTNGGTTSTAAVIRGGQDGVVINGATGTVANYGTIAGAGRDGAILFGGGGFANSGTGALVSGAATGIYLGGPGSVSNAGAVAGTGGDGVILASGGSLGNTGTIAGHYAAVVSKGAGGGTVSNSGLISGAIGVDAIDGSSAANSVVNTGMITASATVRYLGAGDGVVLFPGGSVTNTGTGALLAGNFNGVYLPRFGVVGNSGTIVGTLADGIILDAGGGVSSTAGLISGKYVGVYERAGGAISNGGTISGQFGIFVQAGAQATIANTGTVASTSLDAVLAFSGGTVTNGPSALISGALHGLYLGPPASLTNNGRIAGFAGDAAILAGGGIVSNATVTAAMTGLYSGILAGGVNLAVANAGTITGTRADGVLMTGGALTVNNTGFITGKYVGIASIGAGAAVTNSGVGTIGATAGYGIALLGGGTITNSGVISGAISGIDVADNTTVSIANYGVIGGGAAIRIGSGGTAALAGILASQVVIFANDQGQSGVLSLSVPLQFAGTIAGFEGKANSLTQSDAIDLVNTAATSLRFSGPQPSSAGTLTVFNGSSIVAQFAVTADANRTGFNLIADGHGGTDIVDPPQSYTLFSIGQTASAAYAFGLSAAGWFQRSG